jgi:hypothetical protein
MTQAELATLRKGDLVIRKFLLLGLESKISFSKFVDKCNLYVEEKLEWYFILQFKKLNRINFKKIIIYFKKNEMCYYYKGVNSFSNDMNIPLIGTRVYLHNVKKRINFYRKHPRKLKYLYLKDYELL